MEFNGNSIEERELVKCAKGIIFSIYLYLQKIKGYKAVEDMLRDQKTLDIINGALKEISLVSKIKAREKTLNVSDVLKGTDINGELKKRNPEIGINLGRDGCLTGYTLLCSRNGILPYYLAVLLGYAFRYYSEIANPDVDKLVKVEGIRYAVKKYCQIQREVQAANLIAEQYEKVLKGKEADYNKASIDLIKKAYETGFHFEQNHGGCAQCTVAALYKIMNRDIDVLFQSVTTLAGGGALCTDGSCGSYSGGLVIIGNYIGRTYEGMFKFDDQEQMDKSYEMGQRLHDKFINCYNGVRCVDVQRAIFDKVYLLRDDEQHEAFPGGEGDKCPPVVASTSSWVAEILLEEGFINA